MSPRPEGLMTVLVWVLLGAAPTAYAQQTSAPVRIVTSLPSADGSQLVLVGSSGQLYRKDPERALWRRESIGGVAVTVGGVVRGPGARVVVVGTRTPVYRRAQGAWHASPLANRGTTVVGGPGSLAVLTVGRHIYLPRGTRWTRKTTSNRAITAVWARSPKQLYVADVKGRLRYYAGSWSQVRVRLQPGDYVAAFAGDKRELFGRTHNGAVARVRGKTARLLAPTPELGSFVARRIAPAHGGGAWILGVATIDGQPRPVLAHTSKNTLTHTEDLPEIDAGDRFTVLHSDALGGLTLVTERGAVHLRAAQGQWTRGRVSGELPAGAIRSFEAAPAPSL